jgi:hypothetical protein
MKPVGTKVAQGADRMERTLLLLATAALLGAALCTTLPLSATALAHGATLCTKRLRLATATAMCGIPGTASLILGCSGF